MEKRDPHTRLDNVNILVRQGHLQITRVAMDDSYDLGITDPWAEITAELLSLTDSQHSKSVSDTNGGPYWHEAYKVTTKRGYRAYIKFVVTTTEVQVTSFKEE